MGKGRLEAFSDGVIAIIITIMVLEMKVPNGTDWAALRSMIPVFGTYALSFTFVAIYWHNHHHLLHAVHRVNGRILWANTHLLFWLSLTPFVMHWMEAGHFQPLPVALYGVLLMLSGTAYYILVRALLRHHGHGSALAEAVGRDVKGKVSVVLYGIAIPGAFYHTWISGILYVTVAVMWLIPDRRIETVLERQAAEKNSQ